MSAISAVAAAAGGAEAPAAPTAPSVADYLAQGPAPWLPASLDARRWWPDLVVAADGSGTHRTVQAAVDAVPANASRRWFIQIKPGTYRGPLCVRGKGPLTLYGDPAQPQAVSLVDSRYSGLPKRAGVDAAQPCLPRLNDATHGTSGSATVIVANDDTVLAHLSIVNDADEQRAAQAATPASAQLAAAASSPSAPATAAVDPHTGRQAVALLTLADRVQLEDVRLIGHQDTFYVRTPTAGAAARVFVRGSLIAGDVDFIFGNATLVIDDSTLLSRLSRGGVGPQGHVLAPSTAASTRWGFLVQRSRWVAEPGVAAGSVSLGRAWDEGVSPGSWKPETSPNGQAWLRDNQLGPHLAGWAASTAKRPYAASGPEANRFFTGGNVQIPADAAREVLGPQDGWAAAEGGTRGGADAAPADVHLVRNRAQLVAALRPHDRPRIVQIQGTIDLSTDDAGRPLGAEAFRDPAFNWPAYAAAYDPATWGRDDPTGPLEEARERSARAQAAHVRLKLPSRTTLIGLGADARIIHGGLSLDKVSDVIVRNIHFSDAYDHFPGWEPRDNVHGEWNSEYDNLTLRGARHVWVDHCSFDDGDRPDSAEPTLLGRRMQRHDGLLDVTLQSDLVTMSWNRFSSHDKTSLIGSSDKELADAGKLRVTVHHNLWHDTHERSPRVRFGQVHVFNNLYEASDAENFGYSLGVGFKSALYSQHNAWEVPPELSPQRLLRLLKGDAFEDHGSLLNDAPVDLLAQLRAAYPGNTIAGTVGWQPRWVSTVDPAAEVAARVRAGAGAGRLWVPAR